MQPLNQRRAQRGLTLVELMVGITIGMFIVAAASMLTVGQLTDNRRLMLETEVQQELRATMDLVVRDLRRASYWSNAADGVWRGDATAIAQNPRGEIDGDDDADTLNFSYDLPGGETAAGFKLEGATVKMRIGDAWQPVTDPQTLAVTFFEMKPVGAPPINLGTFCVRGCSADTCPMLTVREIHVTIVGQAVHDATVVRRMEQTVRLPNDSVGGFCAS